MPDDAEVRQHKLRTAFKVFDQGGDGQISRDEFVAIMTRPTKRSEPLKEEAADKAFRACDVDGNGVLDFDEFVSAWISGAVRGKRSLATSYTELEQLGKGGFGVVAKARTRGDGPKSIPETVAVKHMAREKIEDGGMSMDDVWREIAIMQSLSHPNCLLLHEVFDTGDELQMVMDIASGGDVFRRIEDPSFYFSEQVAAHVIHGLCCALQHLHERGIVHRDIKAENVLFVSQSPTAEIKLADFGLSQFVSADVKHMDLAHSPYYVPPEILLKKGYNDGSVDMWSVGVLLYWMLVGVPPFNSDKSDPKGRAYQKAHHQGARPATHCPSRAPAQLAESCA